MSTTVTWHRVKPQTFAAFVEDPGASADGKYGCPTFDVVKQISHSNVWTNYESLLNNYNASGVEPFRIPVLGSDKIDGGKLSGDVRVSSPAAVVVTAEKLRKVSPKRLWTRIDERRALCWWWCRTDGIRIMKHAILSWYSQVRLFYIDAADDGDAVIVIMG